MDWFSPPAIICGVVGLIVGFFVGLLVMRKRGRKQTAVVPQKDPSALSHSIAGLVSSVNNLERKNVELRRRSIELQQLHDEKDEAQGKEPPSSQGSAVVEMKARDDAVLAAATSRRTAGGRSRRSSRLGNALKSFGAARRTFVMGGKKHTPLSYAKVALAKAQPRRGSVADDVLAVVKRLEDEMNRLAEENARLETRIGFLAPTKPKEHGEVLTANLAEKSKSLSSVSSVIDELSHWQKEKEKLTAEIDEWKAGFMQMNQCDPTEADMGPIAKAREGLARAKRGEEQAMEKLLEQSGEKALHYGSWHKQHFRWTCCGNRDERSRYCCTCGTNWHMEPNWKVACKVVQLDTHTARRRAGRQVVRNASIAQGSDMLGAVGLKDMFSSEHEKGAFTGGAGAGAMKKHKRSSSVPTTMPSAATRRFNDLQLEAVHEDGE